MAHVWQGHESEAPTYPYYDDRDSLPSKPRWLLPATASRPVDSDEQASPPHPGTPTVLLDTLANIDGERNATTAGAARTDGRLIQVTFLIARPPRVSHLVVHCPGLEPDTFHTLPRVVTIQDDLALLRVPVYPEHVRGHDHTDEFFVYRAGAGHRPPILRAIPSPEKHFYGDTKVGILHFPTDDDRYVIAMLKRHVYTHLFDPVHRIHQFDSETLAWTTKQVYFDSPLREGSARLNSLNCQHASTSKVIVMGGKRGSMGWVDLWHGILVYDVLRGKDKVRYVALPSPPPKTGLEGWPGNVRDITVINGVVRYFAMSSLGVHTANVVVGEWYAEAWKMKKPWKKWQDEFHLKASDIRVDDARHSELLCKLAGDDDAERKKPVLRRLRVGSPMLSLEDEDVVYILTRPMHQDHKAWVLAVDMRTKTLRGMDELDAGKTTGFTLTYTQSEIFRERPG